MKCFALIIFFLSSLASGFSCPKIKIENRTKRWNKIDTRVFNLNKKSFCERKTKDVSPCMIRFIKVSYNSYYVVCGKKRRTKVVPLK